MRAVACVLALGVAATALGAAWQLTAPPEAVRIADDQYVLTPESPAMATVRSALDDIATTAVTTPGELPGYDDVALQEDLGRAWASGMDGHIWRIDLATGLQQRFAKTPLIPAGLRIDPRNPDTLYFCASRLQGVNHPPGEQPGLYRLHLGTCTITPVALRVPATVEPPAPERVHVAAGASYLAPEQMSAQNSRAIAFCNDLDISADGRRLYFSEPFALEGASMGGGAFHEAIARSRNSRVWQVDLDRGTRLVAEGFAFMDGILVEPGAGTDAEASVLVTETTNFRLLRLHLAGSRAGSVDELQASLPGLPDGLDRDPQGRLWIGLLKERSAVTTWLHNNPWIKPLFLRLPHRLLPIPKRTGLMALSPDGRTPLFVSFHDGARVPDISVVSAGRTTLYPARFEINSRGFVRMPYPAALAPSTD